MDTEEMYRRGFADGERDDLHPFYYEHYYHYRRGYDRARKQHRQPDARGQMPLRRPLIVLLVCAAIIVGGGGLLLRSRAQSQTAAQPALPATVASIRIAMATSTPVLPTNTPLPPPTVPPAVLHTGGRATVTNKQGLNGRQKPSIKSTVKAKFKVGEQVQVREGPVDADGYTWWRLESQSGTGWSAQQSKDGEVWIQAEPD